MTFSYGLVLALLLLAPGFGAYAGLFAGVQSAAFRPGAPSPTSILTLGVIVFGALLAHLAWAAVCVADGVWAARGGPVWVRGVPDAYEVLFAGAGRDPAALSDRGVLSFLATTLLLTAASFGAAAQAVRIGPVRPYALRLVYGWLAGLVGEPSDRRAVTAFVLTQADQDGSAAGYEGVVLNLVVTADKEIAVIVLGEAESFSLKTTNEGVVRRAVPRRAPITQLYLDRSQIRNVAFRVYEVED